MTILKTALNAYSLAVLLTTQLFFGLHLALRDDLLFSSPPLAMAVYAGGAILPLAGGLLLLAWGARLPLPNSFAPMTTGKWLGATLSVALILLAGFQWMAPKWGLLSRELLPEWRLYSVLPLLFALSALVVSRHPQPAALAIRTMNLARLVTMLWLLTLAGWMVASTSTPGVVPGNHHTVMIVLDGLPGQYLNTYNPKATPTALDKLFAQGSLYTNLYATQPWTNAWFGTFYSGMPDSTFNRTREVRKGVNLFSLLEQAQVRPRWITFHSNGIPEGSAASVAGYGGVRSLLLGSRLGALPRALGVNYHFTYRDQVAEIGTILRSPPRQGVYTLLNGAPRAYSNQFLELLLPELRQQVAAGGASFTLFHTNWKRTLPDTTIAHAWDAAEGDATGKLGQFRADHYRYPLSDPAAVAVVEQLASSVTPQLEQVGQELLALWEELTTDPQLRGIRLVITADHGTIYDKGRVWYGYHPNEEVLRVPGVILDGVTSGARLGLFDTTDLARGILDLHGVSATLDPESVSPLNHPGHQWLAAVTMESPAEWYLVLYQAGGTKYLFNLAPGGGGGWTAHRVEGYDEVELARGEEPPPGVVEPLRAALARFELPTERLHPRYRRLAAGHADG